MTNKSERTSAKIYQFPPRRAAHRDLLPGERALGRRPALGATPRGDSGVDIGEAWYHQAEIDKENPRRDH